MQVCSVIMRQSSCEGWIYGLADTIINNTVAVNLQPGYLCTDAYNFCPSYDATFVKLNETEYENEILGDKPELIANDDFVDSLYASILADPNRE